MYWFKPKNYKSNYFEYKYIQKFQCFGNFIIKVYVNTFFCSFSGIGNIEAVEHARFGC